MDTPQKWTCPLCTYANWPKSRKCTVCSFIRELPQLSDDMSRQGVSVCKENSPPEERCNIGWSCTRCTFLNTPASAKCFQCGNLQSNLSVSSDPANFGATVMDQVINKWTCTRCTYANWPKSKSCVMCRSIKPPTQALMVDENQAGKSALSDVNSFRSSSNVSEQSTDDSWLNACKAILLGEPPMIDACLRSDQPPHRRLTTEESKILEHWFTHELKLNPESPSSYNSTFQTKAAVLASNSCSKLKSLVCPYKPGLTLFEIASASQRSDLPFVFETNKPSPPDSSLAENVVDLQRIDLNTNILSQPATEFSQLNHQLSCPPSQSSELRRRFFSKRSPCQASPYMAKELRRILLTSLRQRKGNFQCNYVSVEMGTFALPAEVRDLSPLVRNLLFAELLDTEAQAELENRSDAINWWVTGDQQPTSRLFALWNRTDGDCLLDSLLQASWGVFDRQKTLRHALSESMLACESTFFRIWRAHEEFQAADQYRLNDSQLLRDWESSVQAAIQPNSSLEQIHIFVLCHILRRPVIVYGIKYINNFRDEPIGISNFQGIYLPLLWERSFCSRNPLILGYTRGHFNALVPMVPNYVSHVPPKLKSDKIFSDTDALLEDSELTQSDGVSNVQLETDKPPQSSHSSSPDVSSTNLCDSPKRTEIVDSVAFPSSNSGTIPRFPFSPGKINNFSSTLYVPLFDRNSQPLPVHFSSPTDVNSVTALLRDRLEVVPTKRGFFLACLRLQPQNNLVANLINDWLSIYRNISDFDTSVLTAAAGGSSGGGFC